MAGELPGCRWEGGGRWCGLGSRLRDDRAVCGSRLELARLLLADSGRGGPRTPGPVG